MSEREVYLLGVSGNLCDSVGKSVLSDFLVADFRLGLEIRNSQVNLEVVDIDVGRRGVLPDSGS